MKVFKILIVPLVFLIMWNVSAWAIKDLVTDDSGLRSLVSFFIAVITSVFFMINAIDNDFI